MLHASIGIELPVVLDIGYRVPSLVSF